MAIGRLNSTIRVLMVEDSQSDSRLIEAYLSDARETYSIDCQSRLSDAIDRLENWIADVILLDLQLPDSSGLETFERLYSKAKEIPIVILSGNTDEYLALTAVSHGAQDYLSKDKMDSDYLARSIRYAMERKLKTRAERQLTAAAELQRKLLPRTTLEVPGFDIAGRCDPAIWIGGDYFDYFLSGQHDLWLAIADVSGHGLSAGIVMNQTRTAIRAMISILAESNAGQVLTQTNKLLCDDLDGDQFVTLFLACLNLDTRRLRYACAGHQGYLLDDTSTAITLESDDPPIGIIPTHQFDSVETILQPDQLLALYTDGIHESHRNTHHLFGNDRTLDLIRKNRNESARIIGDRLVEAAVEFMQDATQHDDMTVLIVK